MHPEQRLRWKSDTYQGTPPRGKITRFSDRSRDRLRSLCHELAVDHAPDLMLTLTYPGRWHEVAGDGRQVKEQLKALRKRLERYFAPLGITSWSALWWLEFQARGAPHLHLYLWGPGLSALDLRQMKRWISRAWPQVVDHPVEAEYRKHLKAGTTLEWATSKTFGYAVKYATKAEQKEVPAAHKNPGRFWGTWSVDVPAPIVLSVALPLPRLAQIVDTLAGTIERHSPAYASKLRENFTDVTGAGWSFAARVYGENAVRAMLEADLTPEQPTARSGAPPQGAERSYLSLS